MELSEVRDVVGEIAAMLARDAAPDAAAVSLLAARHRELVEQTNARLRHCGQLLEQGLRSEALQKCDAEPNLLAIVSELDFPESEVWSEILQQFGERRPPELRVDLAEELNEAHSVQAPLRALLRNHRLLALSRAPLPKRLNVMRKIAEVDRGNPIWPADIRKFERVRLEELTRQLSLPEVNQDAVQLRKVVSELSDPAWLELPPKALVEQAERHLETINAAEAHTSLNALLKELQAAHKESDVARGRELRNRWRAEFQAASQLVGAELAGAAAPALAWLEEHERRQQTDSEFRELLSQLERALDEGASPLALNRISYAISRHERQLPPLLEKRLEERLTQLKSEQRRRTMLLVMAFLLAALGILAALAFALRGSATQSQADPDLRLHLKAEFKDPLAFETALLRNAVAG